jgi:hypothetical protein
LRSPFGFICYGSTLPDRIANQGMKNFHFGHRCGGAQY